CATFSFRKLSASRFWILFRSNGTHNLFGVPSDKTPMSFLRYVVSVSFPNSRSYSHCLQHFNDDVDVVSLFNRTLHKKHTPPAIEFGKILGIKPNVVTYNV
ncbi:hypothetical protein KIW84_013314, partial [Lathyrus oleraceus]